MNFRTWAAAGLTLCATATLSACVGPFSSAPSTPAAAPSVLKVPEHMDGELARATLVSGTVETKEWQKAPATASYIIAARCLRSDGGALGYTVWVDEQSQATGEINCDGLPLLDRVGPIKAGSAVRLELAKTSVPGDAWIMVASES
jgi:hypothetical protein